MRNTFSISFYGRSSKANKDGLVHLELGINVNQKRLFINLPFLVEPTKFNSKRRPKEYEDYISLMRTRVNQIMVDMLANEEPITADRIREYVRTGGYKSYTVGDMFTDYLAVLKKRVGKTMSQSVYRRYELVSEMYKGDKTKEINAITQQDVNDFKDLLLEKYDTNTAVGYMSKFKSFIKYAINNGKLKTNPSAYVKINRVKKDIDYLTEDEINTLIATDIDNESLQAVKDIFIFQCASGMSYADVLQLAKSDIKETNGTYYVQKNRQKTGTEFTAVILPFGVDILKKNNYNLKVISNQKMNAYLKVIGNLVGFKKKLHTHLARHSYLTLLLNKGVRIETVSKCAGHSNVKVTQTFYAQIHKDTVVNEVAATFR